MTPWQGMGPDLENYLDTAATTPPAAAVLEAMRRQMEAFDHVIMADIAHEPATVLAERLPSASLQVVAGANHLLPVTHHRLLSNLLLEMLADS